MTNSSVTIGINGFFLGKPHTGIGKYVFHLLEGLARQFPHLTFYVYCPPSTSHVLKDHTLFTYPNLTLRTVDVRFYRREDYLWKYVWERFHLPGAAGKDNVDLFWSPYHSTSRFQAIPHVMTVHDVVHHVDKRYVLNHRRAWYMKRSDKAAQEADHILTVSQSSQTDITEELAIPPVRVTAIPHGAPHLPDTSETISLSSPFLLYVGGFDLRKNVPMLLEGYHRLTHHYPGPHPLLVMLGSIPDAPITSPIKQEIVRLNLEKYVYLPGKVSEEMLAAYLQKAQLLVYPSGYEGFGLPILEGMQAGTPVVTSQWGAMAEVAGEAAELTDSTSPEALAESFYTVLSDSDYQRKLSHKGSERVGQFQWEEAARATGNVLERHLPS
jgi:glycosyltransferase involved in cell wall biosynthesis